VSFDPMGDVYVPATTAANTLFRFSTGGAAPNPPGFFYYPDRKWVDMMAFYQQREIAVPWLGPNGESTGLQTSLLHEAAASAFDVPTKLLLAIKDFKLNSAALTLNPFEPSPPPVTVDIDWASYGDVDANPYSLRKSAMKLTGVSGLGDRNLRATVEFKPSDTSLTWKSIGEIKLPADAPVATGSVKSGTFFPNKNNTRDLFRASAGAWKTASMFDIRVCIDAEGLNARPESPVLRLPSVAAGNYLFTAGFESADKGCVVKTKALAITRDTLWRPLPPQRTTGDVGMADTTKSGGEDASGATDNGSEKVCADTAMGRRCDSASASSMGGKGFFGRSFYNSKSYSSKTENKNGSGSASTKSEAEMMGFQVIDLDDAEQERGWASEAETPAQGIEITITPNWELIIKGLEALNPPGPPPKPRFMGKAVKGRMGLGVGVGLEATVQIGPIPGRLIASFGLGFSVGLKFKLGFQSESPYPCTTGNSNDKCFTASTDRKTQPEALKACASRGARLAEIRGVRDRDGIMAAAGNSMHYWIGGQLAYQYADLNCADNTAGLDMETCKRESQTSFRWMGTDREIARTSGVNGTVDYMNYAQIPARPPGGISLVSAVPTAAGLAYHGGYQRIATVPQSAALPYVCEYDAVAKTKYSDISLGLELAVSVGLSIGFYIPNEHFGFGIEGFVDFISVSLTPTVGYREFVLYDNSGNWLGSRGATYTEGPWQINLLSCGVNAVANFVLFSAKWPLLSYPGFTVASGKLWDVTWSTRQSSAMRPETPVEAPSPDPVIPADQRVVLIEGETVGTEHTIGRAADDGWEANTAQDNPGYLVSGPARNDVPAGQRTATFRMKIDNNQGGDHVARLEVIEMPANRTLAARDVYRSDFYAANTYVDFALPFTMPANAQVLFRVYWTDRATVNVDRITAKARRLDLRNNVTVDDGYWGAWQGMRYCPDDSYVTGYHMRVEDPTDGDDTALNSVELQCTDKTNAKTNLSAHRGFWGSWKGWSYCPNGGFVKGGQLKIEGQQGGGDDTAANSLKVQCTSSNDWIEAPGGGPWGNWRNQVSCPTGQVACGVEVRIETPIDGDDTAMNGLRFACCDAPTWTAGVAPVKKDLAVDNTTGAWAGGKPGATCASGAGLVGISRPTSETRLHAAMCGRDGAGFGGTEAAILSLPNDQRRTSRNGDWAPGFNKLECGLAEYAAGISQGSANNAGVAAIRCASASANINRNCEHRLLANGAGYSNAYGDWDPYYYKSDCPANKVMVGLSVVPNTFQANGIYCCEP
jgi:Vitelline membrane outer layer protein I (VOMI)